MSGGSDSTTTSSGPPAWAVPYFQNYMQRSQQTADLPYQPYTGQTVAQLNPYQTTALDAVASRAMQGSPVNSAASGELQKTLGGGYLGQGVASNPYAGSNPYLTQSIDDAQGDVLRNYNLATKPALESAMARSGSFGNSGLQQMQQESQRQLQGELGRISSGMRFQDYGLQAQLGENAANRESSAYQAERSRMQGAAGLAPSIANQDYADANALLSAGGQYQQNAQQNLSDTYQRFLEARNYPREQLATMGSGLGMNIGGTSTSTGPGGNPVGGAMGGALAGAQLGSIVPGIGTGIGALGGGILGAAGGK